MAFSYGANLAFPMIMILLALLVYRHQPGRIQNRVFLVIGISGALFILPIFSAYLFVNDPAVTTPMNRMAVIMTLFQVAIHLYFATVFPEIRNSRPRLSFALIMGPVLVLALPVMTTDLFVRKMTVVPSGDILIMARQTGPLYTGLYAPLVVIYILLATVVFIRQYRSATSGISRKQVIYTALAMAGGGTAATLSCIVLPSLGVTRFYQAGPLLIAPLYVGIMSVNIVFLRAMDVDQLLAGFLLWALAAAVMIFLTGAGVNEIMSHPDRYTLTTATLLLLICFLLGLGYLIWIQPRLSMRIQRRSRIYAGINDRFHDQILRLKSLEDLETLICDTLEETLGPDHMAIFLRERGELTFFLEKGRRYHGPDRIDFETDHLHPIPKFGQVIEKEQVIRDPWYAPYRKTALRYFDRFSCVIIVPVTYGDRILGLINIGERASGFYRQAEMDFLARLMKGINVAFSNSMLFHRIETMNTALSRFVPTPCLELMGHRDITRVQLGDNVQRDMTILFCDVQGFTALSEQMTPRENFQFINALLQRVSPVIRDHGGFIDKYMGDAVMALFPGSAEDGVRAGVEMLRRLEGYNREAEKNGSKPVRVGVGVHTGTLMLGTIGEPMRMESTVISDAVNLAQRIEGVTRIFGVPLIVSEVVARQTADSGQQWMRYLGRVRVKGKKEPVALYERFDADPGPNQQLKMDTRELFETGVKAWYDGRVSRAIRCFEEVLASGLDDPAARAYLRQDQRLASGRVEGV